MAVDTAQFSGKATAPKIDRKFYTKTKGGQIEEVFLPDSAFETPTFGRYTIRIKALGEPYEQTSQYGPEKKIRFVFKVMGPDGPCKGRMFGVPMTIMRKNAHGEWYHNVGEGSQVGKLIAAARGKPIDIKGGERFSYLDFLNLDLNAAIDPSEKTDEEGNVVAVYANFVKDSFKSASQQALPEAEPVSATAALADDDDEPAAAHTGNPFLDDDD